MALTAFVMLAFSSVGFAETVFVQAQKIALKNSPAISGADVITLVRGDEVSVVATQGVWLQVEKAGSKGWISKLFISKSKPIGAASLAKEVPVSEAKTSRRRESSYAVSASTRGLLPINRSRSGRESYKSNNEALEKVDRYFISSGDLEKFNAEAIIK